jgi:PAS domain S-box-containing protein
VLEFFRKLLSADFMPHIYCLREPGTIKLHLVSDGVIALSYALIPLALVILLRKRRDLVFPWMFSLFSVFILGCGLTHVFGIITLWHPVYRLDGVVKAITALASFPTAALLFRLLPRVQALPSASRLQLEIEQRHAAESELRTLNRELERRVAERTAQMAESESRFRTLAEAVPNLLWTTDASGHGTYVSTRYEEFTGLAANDLLGVGWIRVLHPEDRQRVQAVWTEAVRSEQPYEVEYRLRRFDGRYCWFMARGVPMRDGQGRISQWMGSSTDVDMMKRTEAALRRSNEELQQFAYAAAHDLQEPLRNVSNAVGLLKHFYSEHRTEAAEKWADGAIEGAQRMYSMVKDLLAYSRALDETDQPLRPVSANEAVASAIANLGDLVVSTGAQLQVDPLPNIRVHGTHLVQLFESLLSNAIKFRKAMVPPTIHISAVRNPAEEWCFSVRDNGIGFDPQYSDKIFGVFKRLHLRTAHSGNGIGLAICARIVGHYGGRIWATGQPNEGAEFHFTLPAEGSD